jgi:Rrf2 family iron-sulfur cluster assembly transcriptional regulator
MLDLSINASKGPVSLNDISQRQDISLSYLEQLFSKLRKHSLVSSVRGPGGGYLLSRKENEIDVAEIIDAVSESLDTTKCQGSGNCQKGATCLTHHLWQDLSEQIYGFLSNITLADLVDKREISEIAQNQQRRQLQNLDGGLERIASSSN